MDVKTIRANIERIDALPTIPKVLKKLLKVIENPKVSMTEIGEFVSSDPVLASRILKVVNSPVYGFPGRISSISQALILLGLNVVRGMLLGVSVFEVMEKTMSGLWDHSMGCAVAARIIAKKKGLKEPEEISIAALLHDIGKVVLSLKFPDDYKKTLELTERDDTFIFEAEKQTFFISHAEAGSWIAQKWNFPRQLYEAIEYHHKPQLSKNTPIYTAIVHLADILIKAKGYGFSGDNHVPVLSETAYKILGFNDVDMLEILNELEESLVASEGEL